MDGSAEGLNPLQEERLRRYQAEAENAKRPRGPETDAERDAYANPGLQELLKTLSSEHDAQAAVYATYEWLQEHGGCPQIDSEHFQAVWSYGRKNKGGNARRWKRDFAGSDPEKKQLFRSLPRPYRAMSAVILKAVEEIQTGAVEPATPEQVEAARLATQSLG